MQADARCPSCKKQFKQQRQQCRLKEQLNIQLNYDSRENLDSFSLSILSEISQTEYVGQRQISKVVRRAYDKDWLNPRCYSAMNWICVILTHAHAVKIPTIVAMRFVLEKLSLVHLCFDVGFNYWIFVLYYGWKGEYSQIVSQYPL